MLEIWLSWLLGVTTELVAVKLDMRLRFRVLVELVAQGNQLDPLAVLDLHAELLGS